MCFPVNIAKACKFIKKGLLRSCFFVNIAKLLRTAFLQNNGCFRINNFFILNIDENYVKYPQN